MKAILPILICSAIAAGLGYYFGHITSPAEAGEGTTLQAVTRTPSTTSQAPAVSSPPPSPVAPTTPDLPAADIDTSTAAAPAPTAAESAFAARAANTMQTLTDTQGRSIQVSIIEVSSTQVKARRSDGREVTIPLNMLSEQDLAFCNYLREQAQKQPAPAAQPANTGDFDWDAYFNS